MEEMLMREAVSIMVWKSWVMFCRGRKATEDPPKLGIVIGTL